MRFLADECRGFAVIKALRANALTQQICYRRVLVAL
jgi:hypothetical protein